MLTPLRVCVVGHTISHEEIVCVVWCTTVRIVRQVCVYSNPRWCVVLCVGVYSNPCWYVVL